jgi:phage repressor protein C with HTH and peptisase S24 domain
MKMASELAATRRERLRYLVTVMQPTEICRLVSALDPARPLSLSQLGQWTHENRNMTEGSARRIERGARLPDRWLDGVGPLDWKESNPALLDLDALPDLTEVPRVRFKLSAGVSGYAVEPETGNGKPIYFRQDWFTLHGYRPERLFSVRVSGASMEPTLWDGDLVVINTDSVEPRDGVAFALNYEGELVIKRLRRNAGAWWAESDNGDQRRFGPKQCTEDVKIIGEVVYKQSERI